MMRNVENAFAGEMEISFCQMMDCRLADELFVRELPKGA